MPEHISAKFFREDRVFHDEIIEEGKGVSKPRLKLLQIASIIDNIVQALLFNDL
jgi:hypothetical protein